jgi:hypothetical protein
MSDGNEVKENAIEKKSGRFKSFKMVGFRGGIEVGGVGPCNSFAHAVNQPRVQKNFRH